jgi:ABC-type multidrug transport system fused ATPase/permease subunit
MLGLIKPQEGDIFYNSESIFSNLNKWRKKISYISQNIFLLDRSIKNNITFNFLNEDADSKKLETAINIAQLKEKITSLPNGIDTNVGSDGLKLSGGERQRIALARALYRNAEIYFMDEATSALDVNTERLILEAIKKDSSDKTVIMIAHRKTTLDKCDQVLTLKDGSLS